MSNEGEKPTIAQDDADALGELLDSSAKSFAPRKTVTDDELDELMDRADQAAAQKAATQFKSFLDEMVTVQEAAFKQMAENGETPSEEEDEETKNMVAAMKQLMSCAGQVANASNEQEFMEGMQMLHDPDSSFEPLMNVFMESFVTKEVMYPPLKELCEKYPAYLAENKEKLDAETYAVYVKQHETISLICAEFEKEPEQPAGTSTSPEQSADQPNRVAIEKIGRMLVDLQSHGYPPAELLGDMPEGWGVGENGAPHVENADQAASQCNLM
ncbi:unnamed protein product [Auanema sp. JU1783]|nr:unnamed protein product [Auanema sp. JU1783]